MIKTLQSEMYPPTQDHQTSATAQQSFERRNKSCSALDLRPRPAKLEPLPALQEKKENLPNIKPGSLDEKIKKIIEYVENKEKSDLLPDDYCKEIKVIPCRSKEKISTIRPVQDSHKTQEDSYTFLNALDEHLNKYETVKDEVRDETDEKPDKIELENPEIEDDVSKMKTESPKEIEKPLEPPKNSPAAMRIAKRFHDENLKHKPLPDVIDDPVYKALNSGRQPFAGGALNVQPMPSAIGWKYYTAPGPTECSKLKVFRPKTAVDKIKTPKEPRPKTGSSTYRKRFLPIDLAICWDLIPDDPSDEPKRSPHIDGSNGSVAPAVFTMIKPNENLEEEQSIPGSCQAVADRIAKGVDENNAVNLPSQVNGKIRSPISLANNKEAIMTCIKPVPENCHKSKTSTPQSLNSISTNAADYARKNPKTAWTQEDTSKAISDRLINLQKENGTKNYNSESPQILKKKHHQSTPNIAAVCEGSHCGTEKSSSGSYKSSKLSKSRSVGSANAALNSNKISPGGSKIYDTLKPQKTLEKKNKNCKACNNTDSYEEHREKNEFKAAFKAGVPKSESSSSGSSSTAKSYKVPKMRIPYAKRSYSIGTLAPPFSLWRENTGQVYPEHWRLASVYQHSYKPIDTRKRPLLASVYQ